VSEGPVVAGDLGDQLAERVAEVAQDQRNGITQGKGDHLAQSSNASRYGNLESRRAL